MEVAGISQGRQSSTDYVKNKREDIKVQKKVINTPTKKINPKDKEFRERQVRMSVDKLNKFLAGEDVHVVYERHDKLNSIMIKIVNNETKEVVMELPPEKILDMVANMCEMVGIIVDKKA